MPWIQGDTDSRRVVYTKNDEVSLAKKLAELGMKASGVGTPHGPAQPAPVLPLPPLVATTDRLLPPQLPMGVRALRLSSELLEEVPLWLREFVDLQTLFLNHNRLREIGHASLLPRGLTCLFVGNNRLTDLASLAPLGRLRVLDARNNRIAALDGVEALTGLTSLNLQGNRLGAGNGHGLCHGLSRLRGLPLAELDLSSNALGDHGRATGQLGDLGSLENLSLSDNPLCGEEGRAYRKATIAALPWLVTLDHEPIRPLERALSLTLGRRGDGEEGPGPPSPRGGEPPRHQGAGGGGAGAGGLQGEDEGGFQGEDEGLPVGVLQPTLARLDDAALRAASEVCRLWRGHAVPEMRLRRERQAREALRAARAAVEEYGKALGRLGALDELQLFSAFLPPQHLVQLGACALILWRCSWDAEGSGYAYRGGAREGLLAPVFGGGGGEPICGHCWGHDGHDVGWQWGLGGDAPGSGSTVGSAGADGADGGGAFGLAGLALTAGGEYARGGLDRSARGGALSVLTEAGVVRNAAPGVAPPGGPGGAEVDLGGGVVAQEGGEMRCGRCGGVLDEDEVLALAGESPTFSVADPTLLSSGPNQEGRRVAEDVADELESYTFRHQIFSAAVGEVFRAGFDLGFLVPRAPLPPDARWNLQLYAGRLSVDAWIPELREDAVERDSPQLTPLCRLVLALAEEGACEEALSTLGHERAGGRGVRGGAESL